MIVLSAFPVLLAALTPIIEAVLIVAGIGAALTDATCTGRLTTAPAISAVDESGGRGWSLGSADGDWASAIGCTLAPTANPFANPARRLFLRSTPGGIGALVARAYRQQPRSAANATHIFNANKLARGGIS